MRIKLNVDFGSLGLAGTIIVLEDDNGIPLSKYWRRRLEDSKTDNCCEVLSAKESKPEKIKASDKPKKTKGETK